MSTAAPPSALVSTLASELASGPSGIAWIYDALARVAGEYELGRAALIVDEPPFGRQVFRHAAPTSTDAWSEGLLFRGENGFHSVGGDDVPYEIQRTLTDLAAVALRLDRFRHEASHDLLTGALNRRAFDEVLNAAAAQSRRYGWPFALVIIDLDRFKDVNDKFGHAAGDECLRIVGAELRRGLRAGDIAARVGGDEFALILPGADADTVKGLEDRLVEAVHRAMPHVDVGFSAGVAVAPADGIDAQSLFRAADDNLYGEKRR